MLSRVVVDWSDPNELCNLTTHQLTEFGQFGDEGADRDCPHAFDGSHDLDLAGHRCLAFDGLGDLLDKRFKLL